MRKYRKRMRQELSWLHKCASLVVWLAIEADYADKAIMERADQMSCGKCQHSYALRPGSDPTRFCDDCCQELLEEVLEAARGLVERAGRKRVTRQVKRVMRG
jgi:hypothetical protein